jgi:hypothetical protein
MKYDEIFFECQGRCVVRKFFGLFQLDYFLDRISVQRYPPPTGGKIPMRSPPCKTVVSSA